MNPHPTDLRNGNVYVYGNGNANGNGTGTALDASGAVDPNKPNAPDASKGSASRRTLPPLTPARAPPPYESAYDADPLLDLDQTPAFDPTDPDSIPDFELDQTVGAYRRSSARCRSCPPLQLDPDPTPHAIGCLPAQPAPAA